MQDKTVYLPIDQLQPNPLQPRGVITPESLSELAQSIKVHGVIEPLVIAETPAGFQIIAGERRWRAARLAGLKEVPVHIKKTTPKEMLEMAIVENVQRTDLNPIDRAKSFERLMKEFGMTNSDISVRIARSAAFVSNTLRMLELPDALKDGLISGVITEGHARALAAIEDPQMMIEAYKIILQKSGSVRMAEELARRFKQKLAKMQGVTDKETEKFDTQTIGKEIDIVASDIQRSFGDNSVVRMHRTRISTKVEIMFRGNPKDTEAQVQLLHKLLSNAEAPELSHGTQVDEYTTRFN